MRPTDRAGGIEGGISNGALLVARVAMKPLATLNRPVLQTVDVVTKESTVSFRERTDVTAVPAMGVVAESMTALVLATEALRKFGGDSLAEIVRNRDGFVGLARHDALVGCRRPRRAESGSARRSDPPHPARRDDGRRKDDDGAAGRRAAGLGLPGLRRRRRGGDGPDGARALRPRRRGGLPARRGRRPRRRLRGIRNRRSSPSPAAPCCVPTIAGVIAAAAPSSGSGPGPRRWPPGSATARAGPCSVTTRPRPLGAPQCRPPPVLRRGGRSRHRRRRTADRGDRPAHPRRAGAPVDRSCRRRHRRRHRGGVRDPVRALSVDLAERAYPVLVGPGARHEVARFVPPGTKSAVIVTQEAVEDAGWVDGAGSRCPRHDLRDPRRGGRQDARHGGRPRPPVRPGGPLAGGRRGRRRRGDRDRRRGLRGGHLPPWDGVRERGHHAAGPGRRRHRRQDGCEPSRGEEPRRRVFWQPNAVLCDTETLSSLPPRVGLRPRRDRQVRLPRRRATAGQPIERAGGALRGDQGRGRGRGRTGGRAADGPQLRPHPGPRARGCGADGPSPTGTCATARPWPSGCCSPPSWRSASGGSTTTRVTTTAGSSGASTCPPTSRRGRRGGASDVHGRDKKAQQDLTFVLDGPNGVEPVHGVAAADVVATLAAMGARS